MEKKDVVGKIVDVIRTSFEQDGFKLKAPNKFEKRKGDSLYIWDLWKMVRTIILFLFRIIFAWRRVTIEDDKVPFSPGWASNSGPTGEIFAYLTHLDISEICCNFKVLICIELQTKIAMITEAKVFHFVQGNSWNLLYGRRLLQVFWCYDNKIYTKTYWKKKISSKFYTAKGRSHADNDSFPHFRLSLL